MPPWLRHPRGALVVAMVAFVYTAWLGANWLPLPYSSGGKIVGLLSIAGGGVAMFFCARRLLGSELAATFAALAYLLSSHVLRVDTLSEQLGISVFAGLLPFAWLMFSRVLDEGRFADAFAAALTFTALLWVQEKLTAVELPFLGAFAIWSWHRAPDRRKAKVRALALFGGLSLLLAAFLIVPSFLDVKYVKLFEGDPFDAWQRSPNLKNLGALARRETTEMSYLGVVLLALIAATLVWPKKRKNRSLYWLCIALMVSAVALAHGQRSVGMATARALFGEENGDWTYATYWTCACGLFAVIAAAGAALTRAKLTTLDARIAAAVALGAVWFVPWFKLLATLPVYSTIRAPSVFSGEPCVFFGALLAGFFVTDVLEPRVGATTARAPQVVALLAVAFVVDASPFAERAIASDVSSQTVEHSRAMFARLGEEASREGGGHPNVSGYTRAAISFGDSPHYPALALMLASAGYLLVDAPESGLDETTQTLGELARYAAIYVTSLPSAQLPPDLQSKITVIDDRPPQLPPQAPRDETISDLVVARPRAERIEARFTASSPCMAVVDESYYPFWRATLDGSQVNVQRVAYGLMGVPVTAGPHELLLEYEAPPAYVLSVLLSTGTLLVGAAMAWRSLRVRGAPAPRPAS